MNCNKKRKIGKSVIENFLEKRMHIIYDKEFMTFGQKLNEAKNAIDKPNYIKFQEVILANDFNDPTLKKISEEDFK